MMEFGVDQGWWSRFDDVGPFKDLNVPITDWSGKTMAHVMAGLGLFQSVGEARRSGWDRPVEVGEFMLKKRRIVVHVMVDAAASN